jgi:two-component system, LytTR family, response regulator
MIRAIIIDDEAHCIERLSRLIETYCKAEILLMDSFSNVEEGIAGTKRLRPDLVFLDVQIKDKTGFDYLQGFIEINFAVIFTTAFEKFAMQAIKFSAVDYLLKPIDADDLKESIVKLKIQISLEDKAKKFDTLLHNLEGKRKRIVVPTMNGFSYFDIDTIIRCQSDVNYTTIFINDNSKLMVAKTLKEFEEMLQEHGFLRVHNSHLVNLNYIQSYVKGKGGYLVMKDKTEIEVSTRRKDELMKMIPK